MEYENLFDLLLDNLKKLFYPGEWIALDLEFSKSELFTMLLVERHGEVIMSTIADYINVSMSTANGIVERLVKGGYLDRDRSDTDRRIVVVRLTGKGKQLIAGLKSTIFDYVRQIDEVLDDGERQLLFKVFNKIITLLGQKSPGNQNEISGSQLKKIEIE